MNKVILMGHITGDPVLSQVPSGIAVTRFSIAVKRRFAKEGQQNVDFINCTAWRRQAEFICKYFKKGSMIAVVGSIQTRSWDAPDGTKRYATDIIVDEAYFAGGKKEEGGLQGSFTDAQAAGKEEEQGSGRMPSFSSAEQSGLCFDEEDDFTDMGTMPDEDLPF